MIENDPCPIENCKGHLIWKHYETGFKNMDGTMGTQRALICDTCETYIPGTRKLKHLAE